MRLPATLFAAALLAGAGAALSPAAPARAAESCEAGDLSKKLHERMKREGKSNAEIREILGSSLKRRVLRGRVADGSGCTADQSEKALKALEVAAKG